MVIIQRITVKNADKNNEGVIINLSVNIFCLQEDTRLIRHLFCILKARGIHSLGCIVRNTDVTRFGGLAKEICFDVEAIFHVFSFVEYRWACPFYIDD